jgi:hypothetical protein
MSLHKNNGVLSLFSLYLQIVMVMVWKYWLFLV